jgi:hypothetical protein
VSDMQDALKRLAQRGTPRGFDHVLAGAAASAGHRTDEDEGGAELGEVEPIPFVTSEPVRRARRPFGSMVAAAGVATLVLVSAFAVSAIVGSGGSGSAEGAVRKLADALSHEDALAAADVIAPDEVGSLHSTLDAAAQKAKELELVQTAGAPLAGVDFNVDGLKLSTQELGDGYTKVTVEGGTFTASTHKAKFSPLMQRALRNTEDNRAQSDLSQLASSQELPTFVVTVRRGGKWYVSAAYTVLEYVREANQLPAADFGSGGRNVSTLGAESPDAAVQDSMRALQRSDWSRLMTMVSPREIPFYDYRAAFTELIRQSSVDENSDGSPATFTIDSMTTNAQVDGDTAKVTLNASGRTDSGKWSIEGGCFTPPGQVVAYCDAGGGAFGLVATPLTATTKGSQITVVKEDGRWFVSPVGTVLDSIDHWISSFDRRALLVLMGLPNELPSDGALTLGRPVLLNSANRRMQVLSFTGRSGEKLLGLAASPSKSPSDVTAQKSGFSSGSVRVFHPDGSELYAAQGVLVGQPLTLPVDGTYTFVVSTWGYVGSTDVTVTIWDAADAPAAAKDNQGETCTYERNSASCSTGSYSVGGGTDIPVLVSPPTAPTAPTFTTSTVPTTNG